MDQPQQKGGADASNFHLNQILRFFLQIDLDASEVIVPLHSLGQVGGVVHSLGDTQSQSDRQMLRIRHGDKDFLS